MEMFNCFPSLPRPGFITYTDINSKDHKMIIPAGNWNAYSICDYITTYLKTNPGIYGTTKATYDISTNVIQFSPYIVVTDTNLQRELGMQAVDLYDAGVVFTSTEGIDLSGVNSIEVDTSWSAVNLPITGKLATIPNNAYFTEEIQFYESAGDPFLVVNQDISSITVYLKDQFGNPLSDWLPESSLYQMPPWSLTLLLDVYGVAELK